MAICHFSIRTISRKTREKTSGKFSKSRSSVSAVAYCATTTLTDSRTGITYNHIHGKREKAACTVDLGLQLPGQDPVFQSGRDCNGLYAKFWSEVECKEKRKDSRTARTFVIALPIEMDREEHKQAIQKFRDFLGKKYGIATQAALHYDHQQNPHCHIVATTRRVSPAGELEEKVRILDSKKSAFREVKGMRHEWAEICNKFLKPKNTSITAEKTADPGETLSQELWHIVKREEEDMSDRTTEAVNRQLLAMGADSYEIGIRSDTKGMIKKQYTPEQLIKAVPYLKSQNARGEDIYIRPSSATQAPLVLLDDLKKDQVNRLAKDGLAPAVVTETSRGNFQAWIKVANEPLPDEIRKIISQNLTKETGSDPGAIGSQRYGRLAGFTNRKPKHAQANGKQPFVLCHSASGQLCQRAHQLVEAAKSQARLNAEKKVQPTAIFAQAVPRQTAKEKHQQQDGTTAEALLKLIALFIKYLTEFLRKIFTRGQPVDYSKADFAVSCRLLKEGYQAPLVEEALFRASPSLEQRKGSSAAARRYAQATVTAAQKHIQEAQNAGKHIQEANIVLSSERKGTERVSRPDSADFGEIRIDRPAGRNVDRTRSARGDSPRSSEDSRDEFSSLAGRTEADRRADERPGQGSCQRIEGPQNQIGDSGKPVGQQGQPRQPGKRAAAGSGRQAGRNAPGFENDQQERVGDGIDFNISGQARPDRKSERPANEGLGRADIDSGFLAYGTQEPNTKRPDRPGCNRARHGQAFHRQQLGNVEKDTPPNRSIPEGFDRDQKKDNDRAEYNFINMTDEEIDQISDDELDRMYFENFNVDELSDAELDNLYNAYCTPPNIDTDEDKDEDYQGPRR